MNARKLIIAAIVPIMALMTCNVQAQDDDWTQATACPGWNNPSNFLMYQGQVGTRTDNVIPNALTAATGMNFSSSTLLSGTQLANETYSGSTVVSSVPNPNNQFRIMSTTDQVSGYPVNRDPATLNHLPFVPTQFNTTDQDINTALTKSIRVGDACGGGKAAGLYYTVTPTPQNGLFVIYYACVVQKPYSTSVHGTQADPSFVIRVMKKNASNQWVQISDTLAYYVTSTPAPGHGATVESGGSYGTMIPQSSFDSVGWHEVNFSGTYIYYKDWAKVVINLSSYLYQQLRIEVLNGDCAYSAHFAYSYVAGECRPMTIVSSGCPPGMSTDVTTLSAPRGMLQYEWGASQWGASNPVTRLDPGGEDSYFTFRTLATGTEAQGLWQYHVQAGDFRVNYRPNAAHTPIMLTDSVGNYQTFRCNMMSAIDPSKPFWSPLYVNVQNTKPTMEIDSLSMCDGTIVLNNRSYVPGDPTRVIDSTTVWICYNNADGTGAADTTFTGQSGVYVTHNTNVRSILVRTNTIDEGCYSEAIYNVKPIQNPRAGMTISNRVLCDADETRIADTTRDVTLRKWYFLNSADSTGTVVDSVIDRNNEYQIINRGFTHAVEPIKLVDFNGLYYVNPYLTTDTIWCSDTAYDTVAVFLHPELEVTGDTIVCQGSQTDATVRAVGVDSCTYEWSRTYGTITGGLPAGDHLAVEPYADTSVYYVKVTSPQGCVAWDSVHAYLVKPKLSVFPTSARICPTDTAIITGFNADHFTWTAQPEDPTLAGQDSLAEIHVSPDVTTVYTMVGHGANNCDASPLTQTITVYPLPVSKVGLSPSAVDSDNPTLTLRDESQYSVASSWLFNNSERVDGKQVVHTFEEALGKDSVYVLLTSFNELNCPTDYYFSIPVYLYTAWFPNAITPTSNDVNSKFKLFALAEYEYFHIGIYNRSGMLVYESDDPNFEWDGTSNGQPCPQGAYVYVCNYRKPGVNELRNMHGTVTIIR